MNIKRDTSADKKAPGEKGEPNAADTIATVDMYKIISLERDTTLVDTALTIDKEYTTNYLRKDNFGLLPLANDGQTYNTLDYGLTRFDPFPGFGFKAKHYAYANAEDISYYNVPTPYTDLMYRSTQSQGQILDALFAVNTSDKLNLFVGYKGLRSIGKYINSISSNGIFRIGGSYNTEGNRYVLKFHFTGQDFSNEENGGIVETDIFEGGDQTSSERERLEVYFDDASTMLKGKRYFIDHEFRLSKSNPNSIVLHHRFNYEDKFFQFKQTTLSDRYGDAYTTSINNRTKYNRMYNMVGAAYSNKTIGDIEFYVEDYTYNYFYNSIILENDFSVAVPNAISDRIDTYGAKYTYYKNKLKVTALVSNSITNQSLANIDVQALYKFDDKNQVSARYQNMNKLPDLNYQLYQSDYKEYNWSNSFNNEKINSFEFEAKTKWLDASLQYSILKDHLYFANTFESDDTANYFDTLYVKPVQYDKTINYLSLKAHKDFRVWKLGLDNTVLYQNVQQSNNVLNVPAFVTCNTLYYTDKWFKKALQIQTGVTFQYFTKYYANDYNPIIGEFYSQDKRKIGSFPLFDFFINAKIQEFRVFLRAEHFNSSFSNPTFYSAPNYPYRDFTVRFGVIWDFFS
ncbi:putative porin [Flavobacterium sp. RHBU_3]|uniref:putative porin n=1 Tax=Flavobacterium sp. RHBU_3 TaxID=3391184 RepID=UPI0039851B20